MKNTLINIIVFAAGAAIGSAVTYALTKKKISDECNQRADAEIAEMKAYLVEKNGAQIKLMRDYIDRTRDILDEGDIAPNDDCDEEFTKEERVDYAKLAIKYSKGVPSVPKKIRTITADELGEEEDYDCEELVYYADGVLAFSMDDSKVDDPENLIGDALNRFGEFHEDDVVYVRNEYLETDYEIVRDARNYSDLDEE